MYKIQKAESKMKKNKMMRFCILIVCCLSAFGIYAQNAEKQLAQGNKKYNLRKYSDAETLFRSASSKNPKKTDASYDKGNAIYRQYQHTEALNTYQQALKTATTKADKHKIFHNMGNALMNQKNYSAAVEAYKNALRNNPHDEETRYNYALAKQKLKDNPNQNNKNNQNNKDNNNQNKDNKDDKNKDNKDKGSDDKKDKGDDKKNQDQNKNDGDNQKDDKEKQDRQQQKQDQGKQQMDNMLKALDNHEKQVRERVQNKEREKEGKPVRATSTKDW